MALRIVPKAENPNSFEHTSRSASAPSAPGLHDTLRHGIGPSLDPTNGQTAPALDSNHPLEARLKNWQATQHNLRQQMLRRTFGMAEPIRRDLEIQGVREGEWRPAVLSLGQPSVHEDILMGRDDTITWEDVFTGEETRRIIGFHDEMEKKLGI